MAGGSFNRFHSVSMTSLNKSPYAGSLAPAARWLRPRALGGTNPSCGAPPCRRATGLALPALRRFWGKGPVCPGMKIARHSLSFSLAPKTMRALVKRYFRFDSRPRARG